MDAEIVVDRARLDVLADGWRQTPAGVHGAAQALGERDPGWCGHLARTPR